MEGRCATCKWAQETPKPWWYGTESEDQFGGPYNTRFLTFPFRCELADMHNATDDSLRMCITIDGSDYCGELWVKPEFGCVQWEAKA